ncbi:UDP-2,3-diacylglucosamine diphosphatase [Suttonella indologenes]|uniref:UDP-2,3-diacylglucosamine hydrolase n=1 Tax=Suttonella indologenes TaxID=13276 RepID=A0A380MJ60_9GAMM|nr:UDP-2,3-diacylglucosamine diphosphatase [Suttonella indologenes]SUO92395.1 UDP-2,3-diacylglucosamine hydrolase [Suttonella indologenes]
MAVFFLADVHLSEKTPDITAAFQACLHRLKADKPEAVFILGDLFDAWLGDALADELACRIAEEIRALSLLCPVFFQRGNRDFLLAAAYCTRSGMNLLPDVYCFEYAGKTLLLMHGDLLCTDDIAYQKMRRILRHRYFYRFAACVPRALARRIAAFLRRQSRERTAAKSAEIMDVNAAALQEMMQRYQADVLIHGHTHRPCVHALEKGRQRIVLGDWRPQGEILRLQADEEELQMDFAMCELIL